MTDNQLLINIIANASHGSGLSGGDRIFIELARRWAKHGTDIKIYVCEEGYRMCKRNNLENVNYIIWQANRYKNLGFIPMYIIKVLNGCIRASKAQCDHNNDIFYSSSDFWPDSIPAMILKLKFKNNIKWIAGFYLFAPKPWQQDSPYKSKRFFIGLFYYLSQLPVYWIVKRYADMIFVTSDPDVDKFITEKRGREKIVVIRGGVETEPSTKYLRSDNVIPVSDRKYDACFVGRFHYQKGVLELIDIWKLVCKRKSDAKLAMIGIGELESEVKNRIVELRLNDNIDLLGFKDGEDKYEIFKQSKIIVHPATYDSGGMAAAEGMAWGLPGVSFDLEALRTYYPKGMLKVPIGNIKTFANSIIELLINKDLYVSTAKDARNLIIEEWDWEKKANEILFIIKNTAH